MKRIGDKHNTIEAMAHHYDQVAQKYVEVFFDDLTDAHILDRFSKLVKKDLLLDVGCGPGNFSRYLADHGKDIIGIDISHEMVKTANRLVHDAAFAIMDMRRLGFKNDTFGGLLVAYSFLHLPEKYAISTLLEFSRVLKANSILCLIVKKGEGEHLLRSPLEGGCNCYIQLWDEKNLLQVLEYCNYSILDCDIFEPESEHEFNFPKICIFAEANS